MASLGDLLVRIGADISGFNTAMEQVSQKAGKAVNEASSKFSGLDKLGSSLTGVGAAMSVGITASLTAIAGLGVSSSATLERLRMGLTAVTGSASETNDQLERLLEVAKLPGLGFEEAIQGSIALQAVGLSAEESERYIKAFGNALATVGRGSADLQGVIVQLQQMSAKSKVVAADVRPIVERVPQIAAIMREQFGTVDTEIIQKMGVSTKQFMEVVVGELEKLPLVTGGIANAFENIRDQATQTFAKIGDILAPVVRRVIDNFLVPLLDGIAKAADWFARLPAPVQAFAGTLAALAAAAGPVLLAVGGIATGISSLTIALGPLAKVLGTSVVALGGWAVAIGAAAAALAALGVWVYQNWDSIKAVLFQAWDGVSEAWQWAWSGITDWLAGVWQGIYNLIGPIWNPITKVLSFIWEGVKANFTAAWEGIKVVLQTVWWQIHSTASAVWGTIVAVFQKFLEWAAKIPGVNKLMTLDEAWTSAKQLKEATEESNKALKDNADAADRSGKANSAAAKDVGKVADAYGKVSKQIKQTTPELEVLALVVKKQVAERQKLIQQLADHRTHMQLEKSAARDLADGLDDLNKSVTESINAHREFAEMNPVVQSAIRGTSRAVDDYYETLDRAGIQSHETFEQIAREASVMYEKIAFDPRSTQWEKDNSLLRMLRAQADAMRVAGQQIPDDMARMMEDLEDRTSLGSKRVNDKWNDMCASIDRSVTDLSTSMVQSLFEGDFSFADKGIKALKGLGEAVVTQFVTPATKAISGFIATTIADLLGGKGLGGVMDSLKGIGGAFSGIFGGGSAASGAAAGNAAGGAGSVGSAGGAASGVWGALSGIGSIGSMVTGIIGAFQGARQEGTLNAIEGNTRKTTIFIGEQADSLLATSHVIRNSITDFFAGGASFRTLIDLTMELTNALVWGIIRGDNPQLATITNGINGIKKITETSIAPSVDRLADVVRDTFRNFKGGNTITVNVTSPDPAMAGSSVVAALQAQGAM